MKFGIMSCTLRAFFTSFETEGAKATITVDCPLAILQKSLRPSGVHAKYMAVLTR